MATLRPGQLLSLLKQTIAAQLPLLITGAPGIGKSDIVAQAAAEAEADIIISHPAVSDPTDVKGLPWVAKDAEHATFLPFGDLAKAMKATKPTVWFLDDLGQSAPAVQAGFMQLLLARRVGEHVLPDCVSFVAATNRRIDRAGVQGILEPVKSRFASIVELAPTIDDWTRWALKNNVPAQLIAFLRFKDELLLDFNPTADMTNSPCPRTWGSVAKLMNAGIDASLEHIAFSGAVGEGAATEFLSFLRIARQLPNPDAILVDPDSQPVPTEASALYAISGALAHKANAQNFNRIVRYLERMHQAGYGEFAALAIRDATTKNPEVTTSPAYVVAMSGDIGALITGN